MTTFSHILIVLAIISSIWSLLKISGDGKLSGGVKFLAWIFATIMEGVLFLGFYYVGRFIHWLWIIA